MDAVETLFARKTEQARELLLLKARSAAAAASEAVEKESDIPFEVNKVLYKIQEETLRRAKLSKRKPKDAFDQQQQPELRAD